jgi:hypothetical protein
MPLLATSPLLKNANFVDGTDMLNAFEFCSLIVARAVEYEEGPYKDMPGLIRKGHGPTPPAGSDVADVARAIPDVVDTLFGKRPFRVTIDLADTGAEVINVMGPPHRYGRPAETPRSSLTFVLQMLMVNRSGCHLEEPYTAPGLQKPAKWAITLSSLGRP